uniref:Putative ovule protein n=1 Tax=Solanum chacoense TaxID=4108 RepID=A0A0V0I717_SOLCH
MLEERTGFIYHEYLKQKLKDLIISLEYHPIYYNKSKIFLKFTLRRKNGTNAGEKKEGGICLVPSRKLKMA